MAYTHPNDTVSKTGKRTSRVTLGGTVDAKLQLIAVNTSSGVAVEASDTASRRVVGVNEDETGVSGDIITVTRGVFLFKNSTTAAIAAKDIGAKAYVEDSYTVALSGTNSIVAGQIEDVTSLGVYVSVANSAV